MKRMRAIIEIHPDRQVTFMVFGRNGDVLRSGTTRAGHRGPKDPIRNVARAVEAALKELQGARKAGTVKKGD